MVSGLGFCSSRLGASGRVLGSEIRVVWGFRAPGLGDRSHFTQGFGADSRFLPFSASGWWNCASQVSRFSMNRRTPKPLSSP